MCIIQIAGESGCGQVPRCESCGQVPRCESSFNDSNWSEFDDLWAYHLAVTVIAMLRHRFVRFHDYVPPSLEHLVNCRIDYPERNNVEDGLCCPQDTNIFLTASMSFLQHRLKQKLNDDLLDDKNHRKRTYSNVLILENHPNSKQTKYYLKLKNIDRYDEIFRKEASMPSSALTLNQMLPQPKKPKTSFTIFKQFSTASERKSLNTKSQSTYNLFSNHGNGEKITSNVGKSNLLSQTSTSTTKHLDALVINRITMKPSFQKPNENESVTIIKSSDVPENIESLAPNVMENCNLTKVDNTDSTGASDLSKVDLNSKTGDV
ncbi:hypothetical protein FQA39_LY11353 [Lamprigera yunnana]|nr:hypothetical protein FQA39_LY11353 [Lamprigera yunnana]